MVILKRTHYILDWNILLNSVTSGDFPLFCAVRDRAEPEMMLGRSGKLTIAFFQYLIQRKKNNILPDWMRTQIILAHMYDDNSLCAHLPLGFESL